MLSQNIHETLQNTRPIIAFCYITFYILAGMRLNYVRRNPGPGDRKIDMFSVNPSEMFRSVGYIVGSWPEDIFLRVLVLSARFLLFSFILIFVLSLL